MNWNLSKDSTALKSLKIFSVSAERYLRVNFILLSAFVLTSASDLEIFLRFGALNLFPTRDWSQAPARCKDEGNFAILTSFSSFLGSKKV